MVLTAVQTENGESKRPVARPVVSPASLFQLLVQWPALFPACSLVTGALQIIKSPRKGENVAE